MSYNPNARYTSFVDAEGSVFVLQNGKIYDQYGNSWDLLPNSRQSGWVGGVALTPSQTEAVQDLTDGYMTDVQYDGTSGKVIAYKRQGVQHTVDYSDPSRVVFSNTTGAVRTVNVDGMGRATGILQLAS